MDAEVGGNRVVRLTNRAFVREAECGHPSSEDPALEDERLLVPPEIVEAARYIGLSDEDNFFVVRPIASPQSQTGLEQMSFWAYLADAATRRGAS